MVDTVGLQAKNSYLDWFRHAAYRKRACHRALQLSRDAKTLDVLVKVEIPTPSTVTDVYEATLNKVPETAPGDGLCGK